MMYKSVFALAAILALGSLSLAPAALAQHGGHGGHGGGSHGGGSHSGGSHGGGHFAAPHVAAPHVVAPHVGRHAPGFAVHGPRIVGGHHPAHFVRGHHRHFWHGRWWTYGIGPCWVWSDDYAEYVWICD